MQQVEKSVWNMATIPLHQTYTALNNGGIILGAYDQDEMIGFLYSFPGFKHKEAYVCSHMLGILPSYRKSGLGIQMKQKQAEIAKQAGFQMITWTFDPLESKNAYINIHLLGAVGAIYLENHYGDLDDGLNTGLPTDRMQIKWDMITDKERINQVEEQYVLLTADAQWKPLKQQRDLQSKAYWFVQIPSDFQGLKATDFSLAKAWRFAARDVFQGLFTKGFQATNYLYDQTDHWGYYVFTKK